MNKSNLITSTTLEDNNDLINSVVEQIKEDIESGNEKALCNLLKVIPIHLLQGYLPLEENLEIDLSSNNIFD